MGIVTRADGERLLVVGVKAKSQAADAGIKPGAYVTAVSARSNSRI
jgi:S1-C subfamily serine protease